MANAGPSYGLIVIDQKECTIGTVHGRYIQKLSHAESNIQGKHHHGGQSSLRFERLHDQAVHDWFKRMAERANDCLGEVQGILIGGPGYTKTKWVEGEYLHYLVQKKVMQPLVDVGDTSESGLRELVAQGGKSIADLAIVKERELMVRFLSAVGKDRGATYGKTKVEQALAEGRVEVLLLSEKLPIEKVKELAAIAENTGSKLELIGEETEEGKQLLRAFGGYGGMLRY